MEVGKNTRSVAWGRKNNIARELHDPLAWMALSGILGIAASFVLLVMGIMDRI